MSGRSPRREELLAKAYAYVLANGIGDLSLRPLAAAINSSPRVLLYLFGSKDGLIRALLARARQSEMAYLRSQPDPTAPAEPRDPAVSATQASAEPHDPAVSASPMSAEPHDLAVPPVSTEPRDPTASAATPASAERYNPAAATPMSAESPDLTVSAATPVSVGQRDLAATPVSAESPELAVSAAMSVSAESRDLAALVRTTWTWLSSPDHRQLLTLWLEAYAKSLAEPTGPWATFARDTVTDWLAVLAAAQPPAHRDTAAGAADRTLALAALRGALLDLLATNDLTRTTAAITSAWPDR
jgi:AcrR family transcriptional regulator